MQLWPITIKPVVANVSLPNKYWDFYCSSTKLWEGNVSGDVCLSMLGGGCGCLWYQVSSRKFLEPGPFQRVGMSKGVGMSNGVGVSKEVGMSKGVGMSRGMGIYSCYWHLVMATTHTVGKWVVCILVECFLMLFLSILPKDNLQIIVYSWLTATEYWIL